MEDYEKGTISHSVCVKYYTTLCVNKGEFMCACVCVCMRERGREGGSE